MPSLSVVVITRNEERNLPRLLASVRALDAEVLVVDSGSTDATVALARAAGARVLRRAWTGYGDQRLFATRRAAHDWILSLDADERLTPELAAAVQAELARPEAERAAAYRIHFRHTALGRPVRFGAMWHDRRVRLFDRRRAGWDGAAVHERVVVRGAVATLAGRCDHEGFRDAAQAREKLARYARLKAEARFERGARFHAWQLLRWPAGFLRRYLLDLGFLDGAAGFALARLYAAYDLEKATVLRRLARERAAASPGPLGPPHPQGS